MPYDSDSDDSSVDISDVDVSDDESATSTIPSDDEREEFLVEDKARVRGQRRGRYDDDDDSSVGDRDDSAMVQLKEDKFFERLGHFMKVQRKIEERMQKNWR